MSTEIRPHATASDSWREAICKMIHTVQVRDLAPREFSARISGRAYGTMSCAAFWSKPHQVYAGREQLGHAGAGGYLLSWQLEGDACIEQDGARLHVRPGSVALVDARRAMSITFPQDVRRIVAKLPPGPIEQRLPLLKRRHAISFTPQHFLAQTLFAYLSELADEDSLMSTPDAQTLAENIANLLQIMSARAGLDRLDSTVLRQQTLLQYLRQHACDAGLSLDSAASQLHMSRRLLQALLQGMDTSFTQVVAGERLRRAAAELARSAAPVSQIAYGCGFNDISHFNHLFKRSYGVSPSDYRSQALQASGL